MHVISRQHLGVPLAKGFSLAHFVMVHKHGRQAIALSVLQVLVCIRYIGLTDDKKLGKKVDTPSAGPSAKNELIQGSRAKYWTCGNTLLPLWRGCYGIFGWTITYGEENMSQN